MTDGTRLDDISATNLRIALNEIYADSTYGSIPVADQYDALEVFRAYDDGTLAEAPQALAAYVLHQQRTTV